MRLKSLIASLLFLGILTTPAYISAQVPLFKDACSQTGGGPNGNQSSACRDAKQKADENPLYGPDGIISIAVNILSIVVGIAAVVGIIVAGMKYLTSASNPQEANNARELVIYAVIGLMVASVAQVLVRAVLFKIGV